jgi:hypothetical protein
MEDIKNTIDALSGISDRYFNLVDSTNINSFNYQS